MSTHVQDFLAQARVVTRDLRHRGLIQTALRKYETARDPLHELEELMGRYKFVPSPALEESRFAGGAVGLDTTGVGAG